MVSFAPGRQGPLRCSRSEHGTSLVLFPLEVVLLGVCLYMTCVQEWGRRLGTPPSFSGTAELLLCVVRGRGASAPPESLPSGLPWALGMSSPLC